MICFGRIRAGTLLILGCLVLPIYAQDTTGFIDSLSQANARAPQVEWRKSWFSGEWYNLSFIDNFSFVYNYYAPHPLPAFEDSITNTAFGAAMKDLHTHIHGPRFVLLGYIAADQMWCFIPAVLSPEYVTIDTVDHTCYVDESWYSWREYWERDSALQPKYQRESTFINHALTMWGRLPPNKEVSVYWGADHFVSWNRYKQNDLWTVDNIYVASPFIMDTATYYTDLADYMSGNDGLWKFLGDFTVDGTEPPPPLEPLGWAECTFVDWVTTTRSSAPNWLPEPDAVIGLKFKFKRTTASEVIINYNILQTTTWQGQCMNYPVNDTIPRATGTTRFFDFTVVDTMEVEHKDFLDVDLLSDPGVVPQRVVQSIRRHWVIVKLNYPPGQQEIYHTLWLKAHDYGAQAVVAPFTGQTWKDMMKLRTTAFSQHVWNVNVPRDDDGEFEDGYNYGDLMADAWEEQKLGLPSKSNNPAIRNFVPFYQVDTTSKNITYADRDPNPVGRDIKGDGFCNWEEYRGFMTVGDQFGFYSGPQHKRLNPFFKNVMVHLLPNAECRPEAPGWISALPDTMAYLVDYLTPLKDDAKTRGSFMRWVNTNKHGACFSYYSSHEDLTIPFTTTNLPARPTEILRPENNVYQNAIVFWPLYSGPDTSLIIMQDTIGYGVTWGSIAFERGTLVPNLTKGIMVITSAMDSTFSAPTIFDYYLNNPDSAAVDSIRLIKQTMAHELGHAIAMPHDAFPDYDYIMGFSPVIMVDEFGRARMQLLPPLFEPEYSDSSLSKISIRKEQK